MDIDPEMHMYDCPGTGPGGRGCEVCQDWEGRSFEDIRAQLNPPAAGAAKTQTQQVPAPAPESRRDNHADDCERLTYEGGTCTCATVDEYDREPANMADLEDGVRSDW
ncbi:hypothetical protein [Streptomyces sp. ISL-100]|uniref:hypothetical protein n=1 Tax=Streptomyces sp. ISL-100 TaxID=2819173 RepID=UPI001BE5D8C8|nr:hypothetical protein [Streptomyces sp. ISL-100]MBT2395935.1 hypothetical protein [Streptomyces sp. ISL-100]